MKCVFDFNQAGRRFEVMAEGSGDGFGFAGFCDGVRSVTATRADIAARALLRKHVHGLPEGVLIDLAVARARFDTPARD